MWINDKAVVNKKPDFNKLIEYGFDHMDDEYIFSTDIIDGMFCFNIHVSESGITSCEVVDKETGEEYVLVFNKSVVGAFVGRIRMECDAVLEEIVGKCYEPDIFKSEYAKRIICYVQNRYGTEAEYLWEKSPNNAVLREAKTKKWYAALLSVEKRRIDIDEDGVIEIIDLKETPESIAGLVDGVKYLPGYHMNKKHWYTVRLDESVPIEEICERIDKSFNMIAGGRAGTK